MNKNAICDVGASGYVNVMWKNVWKLKNEIVNRPILRNGKPIGVVTTVNDNYVFGSVFFNAIPEFNADNHIIVGFELVKSKDMGE